MRQWAFMNSCCMEKGKVNIMHSYDSKQVKMFNVQKTQLPKYIFLFSTVIINNQFSCSVVSDSLQPHGLQHARLPCPSSTPGACSNYVHCVSDAIQPSHPLSSPSPPSFNLSASGSFPVSQFFTSGGQNTGISASASVLPMNIQD